MGFSCECEDEYAQFGVETTPVAKTEHTCIECGHTIKLMERYTNIFAVYDDGAHIYKFCERCDDLVAAFSDIAYCHSYGDFFASYGEWLGGANKALDIQARHKAWLPGPDNCFDLIAHIHRQRDFSKVTFGPGSKTDGILDRIRKELIEIKLTPADVTEWIDVVLLAFDGAWRAGFSPEEIATALHSKQIKNESRKWPDWRTVDPEKAIEHIKE